MISAAIASPLRTFSIASARVFTRIGSTDSNRRLAYWDVSIRCDPSCTPNADGGTSLRNATFGLVSSRCTAKPRSAPTSPP